jgi:hypothetical protein
MIGTISRSRDRLGDLGEELGIDASDQAPAPAGSGYASRLAGQRAAAPAARQQAAASAAPRRSFSPDLMAFVRRSLERGEVSPHEIRVALRGAVVSSEDDIRTVLEQTIRLKRAILAMGQDAHRLMAAVDPRTVAALLSSWAKRSVRADAHAGAEPTLSAAP